MTTEQQITLEQVRESVSELLKEWKQTLESSVTGIINEQIPTMLESEYGLTPNVTATIEPTTDPVGGNDGPGTDCTQPANPGDVLTVTDPVASSATSDPDSVNSTTQTMTDKTDSDKISELQKQIEAFQKQIYWEKLNTAATNAGLHPDLVQAIVKTDTYSDRVGDADKIGDIVSDLAKDDRLKATSSPSPNPSVGSGADKPPNLNTLLADLFTA